MPQKKQDKIVVVLYAAAVLLLCLSGVFALLWWRRNECRHSVSPQVRKSGHLSEAGCYRVKPTGCDKAMHETTTPKKLFRDPNGDANADQCKTRNAAFNDWCTRNDAEWLYVSQKQGLGLELD